MKSEIRLTQERHVVSSDRQQVIHNEQEHCVSQDEGHLNGRAVTRLWRQQEAKDVQCDKEAAGQNQIHHIKDWPAFQNDLEMRDFRANQKL